MQSSNGAKVVALAIITGATLGLAFLDRSSVPAAYGLLGTLAGYLFGRLTWRNGADPRQSEEDRAADR